ncbi:MAG TPA: CinA family nicotinamide mononucleotide deamidase-related protein [Longilinea sp.]|nr:CinA family nicotinamide mononucleotide deamidase-related protein [Longilinea sp.]
MPVAEIIAIGTELLLGEIQDTNTQYIARALRDKGIDVFRATLVGDNASRISSLLREAAKRADIVVTTGGLGPTVDDPTREAAALAMGGQTYFSPELWQQVEARFKRMGRNPTENNKRQAFLPQGAHVIENPVGTAPAFYGKVNDSLLICLPGVPREMEYLIQNSVLPLLDERFGLHETIQALVLHCAGVGESVVDEWIGDLETSPNPTVGLLAHPGIVDIRITAKAGSLAEAKLMIQGMADKVKTRVGNAIFGQDADTLEKAVINLLDAYGKSLFIMGFGTQSTLIDRFATVSSKTLHLDVTFPQLVSALETEIRQTDQTIGLAIALLESEMSKHNRLEMALVSKTEVITESRQFSGPEGNIPGWVMNFALNFLRLNLLSLPNHKEQ